MARYGERRGGGGGGGGGGRSSGGGCGGDSEESAIHSFPALQLRQVLLGSAPLGRVASTGTAAAATATATATDSGGGGGAVSGGGGRDAAAAAAADTADAAAAGVGGGGVCDVAESSSLPLVFNEALDSAQREAVTFALESTDVALIHGPPGTGKTTTLVELLLHLVLVQGCKVLLCAPSNVAVDNLLERLVLANPKAQAKVKQQGLVSSSLRLVRLGHPARLTAAVAKHSLDALLASSAPNKKTNKKKGGSAPCLDDNADEEDGEDAWGGLGSSSGGSSEVLQGIREDLARVEQKLGPRRETEAAAATATATATASKKKSCKPAKGVVRTPYERKTLVRQARELRAELQSREKLALKSLLSKANVVCCTCVGAAAKCLDQMGSSSNAKGGQQRGFDVCVIDEAAMALEASCWIPILRCKSLILAGDHCQLPPVVKSAAAVKQGLARTLFERLLDTHDDQTNAGESRVASSTSPISRMLTTQYRMHLDISDWASQAMYGGQLVAAERVRAHTLGDLLLAPTDDLPPPPPSSSCPSTDSAPAAVATTAISAAVAAEDAASLLDWECVRCPLLFIDTVGCGMFEDGDGAEEYMYATPFSALDRSAQGKKKKKKEQTKKGGDGGDEDGDEDGDENDGNGDNSNGDSDDDCGGHTSVVKGAVVASRSNGQEAAVVVAHVKRILRAGLDPKQVAVISPYNGQVDSIRRRLVSAAESATKKLHALATTNPTSTNAGDQPFSGLLLRRLQREAQCASVEVKSVDGFQGAEREALVLSLVRSNANGDCGFVKDPRRLNVAVTRARRHCCVVGDSETFTSGKAPFVAKLLEYIEARGKVVSALETLPDDDDPPPHLQTAPPPPTTPPGAADEGARCGAAGAASDPQHGLEPVPLEAASSSQATDDSSKNVVVEKDGAATSSHAPLSGGCSTTLPSARVSSLSSPIAPLAFSALGGLADLRQGSEYLAHRPKDTAVLLKVKYKSRVASVVASLDETVGCLRRRAVAAHGLDLFFAPATGVGAGSKFLKLLYKGVLGDDTQRLRDSKVKAGASIILLVSGAPPALLAAIAEKEAEDSAVAAAVAGAAIAAVVGAVQPSAQFDSALVKISDVNVVQRIREFAALAAPATTEEEVGCLQDVAAVAESSELPPPTQPKQALVGSGSGGALRFPPTLSPHQRRLVHELAETLNLGHESTGEGGARSIAVFHLPSSTRELPTTYHEESDKGTGPGFEMEAAVKTNTAAAAAAAAGSKSVATTSNAASSARVCKQNGSFLSGSDRPFVDEKKLDLKALHFERQKRREASAAAAAAVATSSDSALSSSSSVVPGRVLGSGALNDEWTMPAPSSVTPPLPKGKQSKKGKPRKLSKSDDVNRGGGVVENTMRELKKEGSSSSSSSSPEADVEEEDDEMAFLNSVLSSRKDEEEAAKAKAKKDPAYGWKRWVDADGVLHHPQAAAEGGGGGRRGGDAVAQGFDDGSDQAALRANLKSSLGAKQESRQKAHQNKKGKSSKNKK